MTLPLSATDKKVQFRENSPHIGKCHIHDGIEQEIVRGLIPSYPSYLDQYLGGAGEMHLHVGWLDKRPIGMENSVGREVIWDYCIVLKKLLTSGQEPMPLKRFSEATHGKVNGKVLPATTDGNKLTVLISIFKATDDSQDVAMGIGSMMVRLKPYDECPSLRLQPFGGGLNAPPQLDILDHELSIFVLSEDVLKQDWETRLRSALFRDTGDNNIIKCTSQVVYEITEHDGNHGVRLLSNMESIPDFLLAIRQPNTCETVRIAACVPHGFLLDLYHVLLSTPKLEPPVVHLTSSQE